MAGRAAAIHERIGGLTFALPAAGLGQVDLRHMLLARRRGGFCVPAHAAWRAASHACLCIDFEVMARADFEMMANEFHRTIQKHGLKLSDSKQHFWTSIRLAR